MPAETITFRLEGQLASEIWECVKRKLRGRNAPQTYSVSEFIRDAIREKIDHQNLSRKSAEKAREQRKVDGGQELIDELAKAVKEQSSDFPRHLEG